jgi:hypothetical protein
MSSICISCEFGSTFGLNIRVIQPFFQVLLGYWRKDAGFFHIAPQYTGYEEIMDELFEKFLIIFDRSILNIEDTYFRFEAVGLFDGFMERTYAYELYHQLRCQQNAGHINDFVIHAEPEKKRTLFFKELVERIEKEKIGSELEEDFQKRVMPDLLIHIPNEPNGNVAIVEIKPEKGCIDKNGFSKDIRVLKEFVVGSKDAKGYHKGIELLFATAGGFSSEDDVRKQYAPIIKKTIGEEWNKFKDKILLMWHPSPQQNAINIKWYQK